MKKGFTLIEVLVVVTIIAILAGIGISQYRTTIWKARMTEIYNMMESARKAFSAQMASHPYMGVVYNCGQSGPNLFELTIACPTYPMGAEFSCCNEEAEGHVHFANSGTPEEIFGIDRYECTWSARTGKFCCPPVAGMGFNEAGEFFIRSMSQRYTSCE